MKKLLFIFGTRPEGIKMIPLIKEVAKYTEMFEYRICNTGQHKEMLDQVMDFFHVSADYELNLMTHGQTLPDFTASCIQALQKVISEYQPDNILVQGDTTTAMIGALCAYYNKITVSHIEAGLRSHNKYSPFPEEINRKIAGVIAAYHFAPTSQAAANLQNEGITDHIYIVGNTVIDALLSGVQEVKADSRIKEDFSYLDTSKRTILVTGHRRESFGKPFEQICNALLRIAERYPDVQIVYPVHLNPNIREVVNSKLSGRKNIFLTAPLDYPHLIWLMYHCYFVLTDSGGIQEEAPSLGKPVLVMREVTEREEGIKAGNAKLTGTDEEVIVNACIELLENKAVYEAMSSAVNPYGDGTAAAQIVHKLKELL